MSVNTIEQQWGGEGEFEKPVQHVFIWLALLPGVPHSIGGDTYRNHTALKQLPGFQNNTIVRK